MFKLHVSKTLIVLALSIAPVAGAYAACPTYYVTCANDPSVISQIVRGDTQAVPGQAAVWDFRRIIFVRCWLS